MLINVLSNIWFYPIITITNKTNEDQLMDIKNLQLDYGFTKIINLDNIFKFWWKNTEKYNNEIQRQIDIKNQDRILKKINYFLRIIEQSFYNSDSSYLFVAINTIDCLIILHLYIYLKYCGIVLENKEMAGIVINIIKNKYNVNIDIDANLKELLY